jgi:ABC-type Fe3+ transport system permease subunit
MRLNSKQSSKQSSNTRKKTTMLDIILSVAFGLFLLLSALCYTFFFLIWWNRRKWTDEQLFTPDDFYQELN